MNTKMIFKICVDFAMTVILVLLMAFEMIGRSMHEWLGAAMFLLFMIHHYFNLYWIKNIHVYKTVVLAEGLFHMV